MEICLLIVARSKIKQLQLCDGGGDLVKGSGEGNLVKAI
jgi:hypothetical protein